MNDSKQKEAPQVQTALRLPEGLLDRIDALAKRMSQPGMVVTRAEILRVATFKGVELLEAEAEKKDGKKR